MGPVANRMPQAPPGYRPLGRQFQAFPPVETTWPEALFHAIRRDIDPEICPMWCQNVYRSSAGGIVTIGRNWIWRAVRDLDGKSMAPYYLPATFGLNKGKSPNLMLLPLEADRTEQQIEDDVSGDPIPLDWSLYDVLWAAREAYEPDYDKDADAREQRHAEAVAASQKSLASRTDDRMSEEWAHFKKNCEALTDADLAAIRQHGIFGIPTAGGSKVTVDYGATR